jgi:hypothetical protein
VKRKYKCNVDDFVREMNERFLRSWIRKQSEGAADTAEIDVSAAEPADLPQNTNDSMSLER